MTEYMNNQNIMVIARYKENINWILELLEEDYIDIDIIIINKGPNNININNNRVQIIDSKNIGREGETYLNYIINNYDNLPEKLFFCQGDPFEHSPTFLYNFKIDNFNLYKNNIFQGLTCKWIDNYPPYYKFNNTFDINKSHIVEYLINIKTLQVCGHNNFIDNGVNGFNGKCNNLWKIMKIPKKYIKFYYSACFYVQKQAILSRDKNFYINLKNWLLRIDSQGGSQGYVLERYWSYIFNPQSFNNLEEYYKDIIKANFVGLFDNKKKKFILLKNNVLKKITENNNSIIIHEEGKILPNIYIQNCIKLYECNCKDITTAINLYLESNTKDIESFSNTKDIELVSNTIEKKNIKINSNKSIFGIKDTKLVSNTIEKKYKINSSPNMMFSMKQIK